MAAGRSRPVPSPDRKPIVALAALLLLTFAVYAPVLGFEFVTWDDPYYVTENPHVIAGLSPAGVVWAFTSTEFANWHPLTWLSHMLDVSLHGLAPRGHHLTSLLLHLANTALLFGALRRLTDSPWRSLAVAALFALHPLHVESVAWVSERKDVLSTAFWFAALWAYGRVTSRVSSVRGWLVGACLVLGLMAKPMVVTLPLTLLVLDLWPLGRLSGSPRAAFGPLVREKLPLFALSLAAALATWMAQKSYGAVTELSLARRLANVVLGAFGYLEKTLWPANLSPFYPYRAEVPTLEVAWKVAVLVLLTAAVLWLGRSRRYLIAGWLWYAVTLAPVSGIVRIGQQQMADRYTYVPLVGLFVMLVWGIADLAARAPWPRSARWALRAAGWACVGLLAVGASRQVGTWKDGVTLWERAIAVGGNSTVSQNNLGVALQDQGRQEEAAAHFAEAIRLEPRNARAHENLGHVRFTQGRFADAARHYADALRLGDASPLLRQNQAKAHYNLANALWREGRLAEAEAAYREAILATPENADFHRALGLVLLQQGRVDDAQTEVGRALQLDPDSAHSHDALGLVLYERGDYFAAWRAVQACRSHGGTPTPSLVESLQQRLPEPPVQ